MVENCISGCTSSTFATNNRSALKLLYAGKLLRNEIRLLAALDSTSVETVGLCASPFQSIVCDHYNLPIRCFSAFVG